MWPAVQTARDCSNYLPLEPNCRAVRPPSPQRGSAAYLRLSASLWHRGRTDRGICINSPVIRGAAPWEMSARNLKLSGYAFPLL